MTVNLTLLQRTNKIQLVAWQRVDCGLNLNTAVGVLSRYPLATDGRGSSMSCTAKGTAAVNAGNDWSTL